MVCYTQDGRWLESVILVWQWQWQRGEGRREQQQNQQRKGGRRPTEEEWLEYCTSSTEPPFGRDRIPEIICWRESTVQAWPCASFHFPGSLLWLLFPFPLPLLHLFLCWEAAGSPWKRNPQGGGARCKAWKGMVPPRREESWLPRMPSPSGESAAHYRRRKVEEWASWAKRGQGTRRGKARHRKRAFTSVDHGFRVHDACSHGRHHHPVHVVRCKYSVHTVQCIYPSYAVPYRRLEAAEGDPTRPGPVGGCARASLGPHLLTPTSYEGPP